MPKFSEMRSARRTQSVISQSDISNKEHMAERILDLAADTQGLFHYINSKQAKIKALAEDERGDDDDFWEAGDNITELFSRLAATEAIREIKAIDSMESLPYSKYLEKLFQLFTSAGACAIWFDGSWFDIIVAGFLGVLVAAICAKTNQVSRDGRVIAEVVASFSVGFIAAIVALSFPEYTCFGAMALSGTIDILQGFRVVFAVIELMGKHTVAGGANFLEGKIASRNPFSFDLDVTTRLTHISFLFRYAIHGFNSHVSQVRTILSHVDHVSVPGRGGILYLPKWHRQSMVLLVCPSCRGCLVRAV